jgi:hypothetical protein
VVAVVAQGLEVVIWQVLMAQMVLIAEDLDAVGTVAHW